MGKTMKVMDGARRESGELVKEVDYLTVMACGAVEMGKGRGG